MKNDIKVEDTQSKVLDLQELDNVDGGAGDAGELDAWSTMSRDCRAPAPNEWSTMSSGC
ncbi:hypothetical protein GCM10027277_45510 [Pseudoduganella ginsengisoli]|uniref:Uncharacterized protein n=1 Tax=Pseudoduganella ginsengisoli TaxID=1462440 RepID=A0A6L6Q1F3_9BURK|nr:hypothetical protein [Pseudoduganella ginsengisoli]MTW03647.1 hypothetical protein [Pseudoduganella ginsengisoli]